MSNVRYLPGADMPAQQVLEAAIENGPLDTCIVVGKSQNGALYFASTTDHGGEVQLLLGRATHYLLRTIAEQSGDA